MTTQRQEGFRGGIQAGTSATTENSRSLDAIVKSAALDIASRISSNASYRSGLTGNQYAHLLGKETPSYPISGLQPDGGLWFLGEQLQISFEAKYQGEKGNAIERFAKNNSLVEIAGARHNVIFATGSGFYENGTAQRTLGAMKLAYSHGGNLWEDQRSFLICYRFATLQEAEERVPQIMTQLLEKVGIFTSS